MDARGTCRRARDLSLSCARVPAAPPARGLGRSIYRHYEWRDFPLLDNISLAADEATLSPVELFIQADIIVKAVMIGLLLASISVWMVIFTNGRGGRSEEHTSEIQTLMRNP